MWHARRWRVPEACEPSLEPGKPSGLVRAEQACAPPLGFMKATRQLTACASKLGT
jgi:hypothetical protein